MDTIDNMISSPNPDDVRLALMLLKSETRTLENILKIDKAILNLYGLIRNNPKPYDGTPLNVRESVIFEENLTEIHEFIFMFISPESLISFNYKSSYYGNKYLIKFTVSDLVNNFFILYVKLEVILNQDPEEFYNHYYKIERPFHEQTHKSKSAPASLFEFYDSINNRITNYIGESASLIIDDLEIKNRDLEDEIEESSDKIETLENEAEYLEDKIIELKNKIENLLDEVSDLEDELSNYENQSNP